MPDPRGMDHNFRTEPAERRRQVTKLDLVVLLMASMTLAALFVAR